MKASRQSLVWKLEPWTPLQLFHLVLLFYLLLSTAPSEVRGRVNELMGVKHSALRESPVCKHEILLDTIKHLRPQQWPSPGAKSSYHCLAKLGSLCKAEHGRSPTGWCWGLDQWPLRLPRSSAKISDPMGWKACPGPTVPALCLCTRPAVLGNSSSAVCILQRELFKYSKKGSLTACLVVVTFATS